MWKFVSRRIRDSVERTYNVLEHRRTWTCGGEKGTTTNATCAEEFGDVRPNDVVPAQKPVLCLVQYYKGHDWHKGSSKDDFRRQQCEFETKQNILGALRWSGAIVCGWYASQILCKRRRHHLQQNAWACNMRGCHSRTLVSPSREFHNSVLAHYEQNTPVDKKRGSVPKWLRKSVDVVDGPRVPHQQFAEVFPVNNDVLYLTSQIQKTDFQQYPSKKDTPTEVVPPSATVENAVGDLLKVVGDIEFQLGVQHLQDENFDIAVTHFKLATSHNHSGATYNLGLCYEQGLGVEPNAKMALQCYTIAAEMGHPKALYNLGIYHGLGLAGLTKSRRTGRQFLKAAARLGQVDALRALGWQLDGVKAKTTIAGGQAPPKHEFSPARDTLLTVSVA